MNKTFHDSLSAIEPGKEYIVVFDGIEYKCIAKDLSSDLPENYIVDKFTGLYVADMPWAIIVKDVTVDGRTVNLASISITRPEKVESVEHTVRIYSEESRTYIKPEYLPDIATGSGLPTVTSADAGKFLRVTDEGIWAAVAMLDVSEVGL